MALDSKIQGFVRCVPQVRLGTARSRFCYVDGQVTLDPPVDLGAFLIERAGGGAAAGAV